MSIVWFRNDLRLADNPALLAASEAGPAVPVFVWEPDEEYPWEPGAASRWWLHHSLAALGSRLAVLGSRLVLRTGPTLKNLRSLLRETGSHAVYWNRRYEPAVVARDEEIRRSLEREGVRVETFNGSLLTEPGGVLTKQGKPYQVFKPYWNAVKERDVEPPTPAPGSLAPPEVWPKSLPLDDLGLLPSVDWAAGMREAWTPGEAGAAARLRTFLDRVETYAGDRDRPDRDGTSSLSPHLHFGEIGPRTIWHRVRAEPYRRELAWRDFGHQLLHHFPETAGEPFVARFERFPWRDDPEALRAWRRGRTGYPIVDAGMRQLWATGWMHNRVRMIVASFLVKHLLLPWQDGARWFWDTLVDADLANNTLNWQWVAGCGADAAPYFRVFNPVLQGEKFDPEGDYVRRWVPELSDVPDESIHKPWSVPAGTSRAAGGAYPGPVVGHSAARERALEAFRSLTREE